MLSSTSVDSGASISIFVAHTPWLLASSVAVSVISWMPISAQVKTDLSIATLWRPQSSTAPKLKSAIDKIYWWSLFKVISIGEFKVGIAALLR